MDNPLLPCPYCGNKTCFHREVTPTVGDHTICKHCYSIVVYKTTLLGELYLDRVAEEMWENGRTNFPEHYALFEAVRAIIIEETLAIKRLNN